MILKLKMLLLYHGTLREWYADVWCHDYDEQMCCNGYMCGCYGATYGEMWDHLWKHRKERK